MKRKGPQRDSEKQRFWQGAVRRWRESGKSIRDYCRENALSEPSFYAWRRELALRRGTSRTARRPRTAARSRRRTPRAGKASFLPLHLLTPGDGRQAAGMAEAALPPAGGGIEIVVAAGRTLRVAAGFDRQTLCDVLAVLEGRPC